MTVPVERGMLRSPLGRYNHDLGLGTRNKIGHAGITFWEGVPRSDGSIERQIALLERMAHLLETDPECQRILQAELEYLR